MPREVRAKICGLTRPEDAAVAARAGAAYLGVVFAGGPRRVTGEEAAAIVRAAPGVPVVGVFGAEPVEEILAIAARAGLRGAQLHGDGYDARAAERLRREGLWVARVVRLAGGGDLGRLGEAAAEADAVLVEPRVAHAAGGAGVPLALELAREARRRLAGSTMMLAGGLTPETVGAAIAAASPDLVDVSSGVEQIPGIKDHSQVLRFLEVVRGRHIPH